VHAGRLRPYLEPGSDRLPLIRESDYSCITRYRRLDTHVGDVANAMTDAIVSPTNANMHRDSGAAPCITRAAGVDYETECREILTRNGPLAVAAPFSTKSGNLSTRVVHVVEPNIHEPPFIDQPLLADSKLEECYFNCLQLADTNSITSLAFPAVSVGEFGMDKWSLSHAAAKALIRFDTETRQTPGTLRRVEFINSSLVFAGIMNIVFRRLFTYSASTTDPFVPEADQVDQTLVNAELLSTLVNDWFEIEQVQFTQIQITK